MRSRPLILALIFSSCMFSCNDEESKNFAAPDEDVVLFDKIQRMGAEAEKTWPGYDYYRTLPSYIILSDEFEGNKRGYLLNPPEPIPAGSKKLNIEQSKGLNIYRNDKFLAQANTFLNGPVFNFYDFKIDDNVYFLIKDKKGVSTTLPFYDQFMDVDDNWLTLTYIHEMFHVYQFATWTFPEDTEQNFTDYPVTGEIATVELALFDLMENVSVTSATSSEERKAQLAKFVVLMEELFRVDPSNGIVEKMVPMELFLEGSARYMEHYSSLNTIYPTVDSDVTHGWTDYIENINPSVVRHFLSIRVWYHVGSGVLYQLKQEGVDFEPMIEDGETAYSITRDYLNLTEAEKANILSVLKSSDEWKVFEEKGIAMASL